MNFEEDDTLYPGSQTLEDSGIYNLLSQLGSTSMKKSVLSSFVTEVAQGVRNSQDLKGEIALSSLTNIVRSKVQKDSLMAKSDLENINRILETLLLKKNSLNEIKSEVIKEVQKKSTRRLKMLYALFGLQIFFTQYGTYYEYSWDIMEPICCLFGIMDSILGYVYWLTHNQDYDFENFEHDYIDKKAGQILGKNVRFEEEINDVEAMINHMEVWKSLSSRNISEILEALDTKFAKV